MNAEDSKTEIFDVFLCHNSEDKPAVREIAQQLARENIKPWLDEADIRGGDFWHTTIGEQIETTKAAAVFVGQHGVGPWQIREIIALLDQFDRRGCRVIPAILASAPVKTVLPWSLVGHHCVDFRAIHSHPLKRLIWGITGQKPAELAEVPTSEKPATMLEVAKSRLIAGTDQQIVSGDAIPKTRLYPPLAEPPGREQAVQLEILRRRVKEYWVDGVLKHSLHNEVQISLGKRQADEFVDAPWKYRVEVSDAVSSGPLADRDVNAIYDAAGLLLILGEPGSGKTTTLLDLARTLLDRARDDLKERVPVVLNLSTWQKNQPLAEWISGELSEKYRVPRKIAHFWLQNSYLLPLLDGLDEVPTALQPDCVNAVNAFIDESNPSGLVVCCRLNEYRWLPERLKLNGAICIEPLSLEEVGKYLAAGGSKLVALREGVDTDPVLQELAQTPLMLSVMSIAFQGAGGAELAGQKADSVEERRKQIFHLYVEQMFQRNLQKLEENRPQARRRERRLAGGGASLVFPKEKTMGWLSWLAGKMRRHSQSIFLVERLQPNWLGPWDERGGYASAVALSLAAIFALICALTGGLIGVLTGGLIDGLIWGLIVGLIVGLSNGLRLGLSTGLLSGPMFGLISGLIVGVIVGPICGLSYGLSNGLIVGLVSGLLSGLVSGLILGPVSRTVLPFFVYADSLFTFRSMSAEEILENLKLLENLSWRVQHDDVTLPDCVKAGKAFPHQGIKLSLKNSLFLLVIIWLAFALIGGSIGWSIGPLIKKGAAFTSVVGLIVGVIVGSICGLIVGLNRGGSVVIKHYALRLILWLKGCMPLNLVAFLDYCARLVLLKKVGGGYIFIHRMLLDYFADIPTRDTFPKR